MVSAIRRGVNGGTAPSLEPMRTSGEGPPEVAEDLTQETFLKAWRSLDRFVVRAPLGAWLHRIAHREFLQALRSQRPHASLEEVVDLPAPRASEPPGTVELRQIMRKLP